MKPLGVAVLVWRPGPEGREWLLLHRSLFGLEHGDDWAWASPGGALEPDEDPEEGARRELAEETGLDLPLAPAPVARGLAAFFLAEAPGDAEVGLSPEQDRYEWVSTAEASVRCRPPWVGELYARVSR